VIDAVTRPRPRRPALLRPLILVALAAAVALGAPTAAAPDPLKASRKCRDTVAKTAARLAKTALTLVDACHQRRDKGKTAVDCNALVNADPKGKLASAEATAVARIAPACATDEPVRDNFPGGAITAALLPMVRTTVETSARAVQGLPDLVEDKAGAKCHRAIGAARTKLVDAILKATLACQKKADKAAMLGTIDPACLADGGKTTARARAAIAKACIPRQGPPVPAEAVGTCTPLPDCVVAAAIATGQQLAGALFHVPSECDDGFLDAGEVCPRLEGPPAAPALDAVHDLDTGDAVPAPEIALDAKGEPIARTQLEIGFAAEATVADVNAVLASIAAEIVSMLDDVLILIVRIPDPGSLAALETIVAELEADPRVRFAVPGTFPATAELPANHQAGAPELTQLDHHLAIGAHAAWNARRAAQAPPAVIVADFFGNGPVDADADTTPAGGAYGTGSLESHGYHVLETIAARFGGAMNDRERATGMAAVTLPTAIVDFVVNATTRLTTALAQNRILHLVRATPGNVILNTSLQSACRTAAEVAANCSVEAAGQEAFRWIEKVRGTPFVFGGALSLEDRFLHATAAGNVTVAGDLDARTASSYAAAGLLPLAVPNLTNLLVVENVLNTAAAPFAPRCLNQSSKRPGDVAGIGTEVWSFTDATAAVGNLTGTSIATPQVAGLAAYLWTLSPTMSVAEVRQTIAETAAPIASPGAGGACDGAAPGPVVDAYAAVLALDQAAPPTPATAPIRLALLDWGEDGAFDQLDLEAFLIEYVEAFVDGSTHGAIVEPATPDFGRFDLNGDGYTGGSRRARFDLDRIGSAQFGPARHTLIAATGAGGGLARPFDERALTDLEILCYYAFSPLYTGSAAARQALIDPGWCNPVTLESVFPTEMEAGSTTLLALQVVVLRADGSRAGMPGAFVEIFPTGGVVDDPTGTTDGDGFFTTPVTAATDAEEIEIDVIVRATPGGSPIAEASVSAAIIAPPPVGTVALEELTAVARIDATIESADLDDLPSFSLTASSDTDPFCAGTMTVNMSVVTAPDGTVTIESDGTGSATGAGSCSTNHVDLQFRVHGAPVSYAFDPAPVAEAPPNVPGDGGHSALVILFAGPQPFVGGGGDPVACWCANECDGRCPAVSPPLDGTLSPGVYSIVGRSRRSGSFDYTLRLGP
jgi:hypothetical protein